MLERAAGCLESAGRRFFRDSNGVLRSRRSFNPHFRQYPGANSEFLHWLVALLQSSDQRSRCTQNSTRAAENARTPFLEFLYPPHTQEFVASRLLRSPRRPIPRRRKAIPGPARYYSSETQSRRQDVHQTVLAPGLSEEAGEQDEKDKPTRSRETLIALFRQRENPDYGLAWVLYSTAGYPPDQTSALLAYLCHSNEPRDHERSIELFGRLGDSRVADDYLHMAMSYLNTNGPEEMKKITREAMANGVGTSTWAFTFTHFLNTASFPDVQEMWDMRPESIHEWTQLVTSNLEHSSLPKTILALATFIADRETDTSTRQFTSFLLDYAFTSPDIAENTASETLLAILRRYSSLGLLGPNHYFALIETLGSSGARVTFTKSMVVYRNFRWQMTAENPPPRTLLRLLFKQAATFGVTNGVRYLLEELAYFIGKPNPRDYRLALNTFAKIGDVQQVYEIFDMLVKDWGRSLTRKLLTPLLLVHASVGNVHDTVIQFNRLKTEFDREPNTACWNMLLMAHSRNHDMARAFSTYDQMMQEGMEPDTHTFGILMGLCAKKGDIENVLYLLGQVKERGVEIRTSLLDPIVEAYCNNKLFDMAEQVAEACLGMNARGDPARMWNILLLNYAFRIDLESVSRIRSRMEAAGIRPDGTTYAALMQSLVLIGQTDSARRILRTLHRSRRVHATEFHYAIILYGYVKARNRDMVHIVFQEIKQRFGRPDFNSRLLLLMSQLQRDLQNVKDSVHPEEAANQRLEHAEQLLRDAISASGSEMLTTKDPSVGLNRGSLKEALPSQYYSSIIAAYGEIGALHRVEELFNEFTENRHRFRGHEDASGLPPLRLFTALMSSLLKTGQYEKVEECWMTVYPKVLQMARHFDVDKHLTGQPSSAEAGEAASRSSPEAAPPLPQRSRGGSGLVVSAEPPKTTEAVKTAPILPSYRFMLEQPLNYYMESLAWRGMTWKIFDVVAEVEKVGFTMTTFNWSTYVRVLSFSDELSDRIKAFATFEDKFMPNFPGWEPLLRGYGLKPAGAPESTHIPERYEPPEGMFGRESRRLWSKVQPDWMQPSYITMVHLAAALNRFREQSISSGNAEIRALYKIAPRTIDVLGTMPYRRDKYQGVLLRGRELRGTDPVSQKVPYVWTGGVLGVGGRRQPSMKELRNEPITEELSEQEPSEVLSKSDASVEQAAEAHTDYGPDEIPPPPLRTLEPEDEHDLETETQLEAQRRAGRPSDEELDIEPPRKPRRNRRQRRAKSRRRKTFFHNDLSRTFNNSDYSEEYNQVNEDDWFGEKKD